MIINFISFIVRLRWSVLGIVMVLTILLTLQTDKLMMDNSNESALIHDDETQKKFDEFKNVFGNDDFIYLLLKTGNIYNPNLLQRVDELTQTLHQEMPHLKRLTWLGSTEQITSDTQGIIIEPVMASLPVTDSDLLNLKKKIQAQPELVGQLISREHDALALLLEFYPYPKVKAGTIEPRQQLAPKLNEILTKFSDLNPNAVGGPIISHTFDQLGAEEMGRLGLISLGVMLLVLILTTRKISGVVIPMCVVVVSLFWTMGLIALIGIPLSTLVIMLPILLVCVGIGDSMHYVADCISKLRQGIVKQEALEETFNQVKLPIIITSLTTVAGFVSFLSIAIQPIRDIGIQAAIGVLVAMVLSLTLSPVLMSFVVAKKMKSSQEKQQLIDNSLEKSNVAKSNAEKNNIEKNPDIFSYILIRIADFSFQHSKKVIAVSVLIIVVSIIGYTMVKPETNSIRDLQKDHPLHVAYNLIDKEMGGSMALEIIVDSGKPGGIKQKEFLTEIEKMQAFVDSLPLTRKSFSILDALKKMRVALHANDKQYYALPQTETQISEYLFLYETGGGAELEKFISFDYQKARIQVRTQSLSSEDVSAFIQAVDDYIANNLNSAYSAYTTGTMAWMSTLADHIVKGQVISFIFAFIAIAVMLFLVFRNVTLTLIAMLPNILPALVCLGIMGFSGIYMHMMLMILAPIIISVSVDDTIHFFFNFRREYKTSGNYQHAIYKTMSGVGRPLLFTTLVLTAGFSVFSFSVMDTLNDFGLLAAVSFVMALVTDFVLVPALLIVFKPLKNSETIVDPVDTSLVVDVNS